MSTPRTSTPRQTGLGLISVLVALLIFSFGILGLVSLYATTVPVGTQNRFAMNAAQAGQAFWAVGNANPQAVPNLGFAHLSDAPSVLAGWVQQLKGSFPPGVDSSATTGPGVDQPSTGTCTSQSCTVQLTISWSQYGLTRSQVFYEQFGF